MVLSNLGWEKVEIPEELRCYCALSEEDVRLFTHIASRAPDPVARLQALVLGRAEAKREACRRERMERMEEDRRRIRATDLWLLAWLPVRSQSWITYENGITHYGRIESENLLTVLIDGGHRKTYPNINELVAQWTVD